MEKLKPCPFCGSEAKTKVLWWRKGSNGDLGLRAIVYCECGVEREVRFEGGNVPFKRYEEAFAKVIEVWNRRVDDDENRNDKHKA